MKTAMSSPPFPPTKTPPSSNSTATPNVSVVVSYPPPPPSPSQDAVFKMKKPLRKLTEEMYKHVPDSLMCEVCEVVPFQFHHYGAFCCNRCRAFFRRLILVY